MAPTFRGPIPTMPSHHSPYQIPIRDHSQISEPHSMIYWNSGVDVDADYLRNQIPQYRTTTSMRSRQSSSSRQYIDPWDMENYDYIIRKNMDSPSEPSFITSESPAGEPVPSTFYYVPGGVEESLPGRTGYAGLDEKSFYNAKYHRDEIDAEAVYSTYTDIETSSGDRNSSCGSTVSTLHLHTPGFGVASGQRRLVLPKPFPPGIEFPGPPSYDYYESHPDYTMENSYCTLNDCYECISGGSGLNIPLYDTLRRKRGNTINSNFGMSKKGLLQIDYSFNWNNLDRLIAK